MNVVREGLEQLPARTKIDTVIVNRERWPAALECGGVVARRTLVDQVAGADVILKCHSGSLGLDVRWSRPSPLQHRRAGLDTRTVVRPEHGRQFDRCDARDC